MQGVVYCCGAAQGAGRLHSQGAAMNKIEDNETGLLTDGDADQLQVIW